MRKSIYSLILTALLFNCTRGQQNIPSQTRIMDNFELSPENAHPNAQKLLTEDFYWSPIEETGPFGSDDGSDSFHGFLEWRQENKDESPLIYLNELIEEWGYPKFDLNVTEPSKIRQALNDIDSRMLIGQDNAVIAVGFGQFVLEGKIDQDIKDLTKNAIKRELSAYLIDEFRSDYRETRKGQLEKMLRVVDQM